MADIITPTGIITGAAVALVPVAAKYVFDKLTESHKVEMGLAAKRRERYHAKQAEAVAGIYERLLRCVDRIGVAGVLPGSSEVDNPALSNEVNKKLAEEAWEAYRELQGYFNANEIYVPRPLAEVVGHYITV